MDNQYSPCGDKVITATNLVKDEDKTKKKYLFMVFPGG